MAPKSGGKCKFGTRAEPPMRSAVRPSSRFLRIRAALNRSVEPHIGSEREGSTLSTAGLERRYVSAGVGRDFNRKTTKDCVPAMGQRSAPGYVRRKLLTLGSVSTARRTETIDESLQSAKRALFGVSGSESTLPDTRRLGGALIRPNSRTANGTTSPPLTTEVPSGCSLMG